MDNKKVLYGVKVKCIENNLYTIYIYESKQKAEEVKKGIEVLKRIINRNNISDRNQIEYEMYCIFSGYITYLTNIDKIKDINKEIKYGKDIEVLNKRVYKKVVRLL